MKWTTVTAVFMACLAVGYCLWCEEAEDCNDGECCVANTINQIRGRGICRRLGRIGNPCNMEDTNLENYGRKYLTKCPCRSEFNCEPAPRYRDSENKLMADLSQRCRRAPRTTTTKVASTTVASTEENTKINEVPSTISPSTDANSDATSTESSTVTETSTE